MQAETELGKPERIVERSGQQTSKFDGWTAFRSGTQNPGGDSSRPAKCAPSPSNALHRDELAEDWELALARKPLNPIDPLE
jgi:hypothetical protein